MSNEHTVIEGKSNIEMFHLLQLKYALKLETLGMKHSQGSAYAYVKRHLGFKGNKKSVFEQLVAHIEILKKEREQEAVIKND